MDLVIYEYQILADEKCSRDQNWSSFFIGAFLQIEAFFWKPQRREPFSACKTATNSTPVFVPGGRSTAEIVQIPMLVDAEDGRT
jgi:hypothetical protein